jgi:tellurite resistance protein TerC
MLPADLFLHRDNHVIGFREAALWSGIWIAAGLLFGVILIYTGYKMAFRHDQQTPPDRNPVVRLVRRIIPTDANFHGDRFFTRIDGKRVATLLFVVLIAVEATDLIFAIDSVAAILAITTSTFIVWTANAFAILGLRSLYFCLAGLLRRFVHLRDSSGFRG